MKNKGLFSGIITVLILVTSLAVSAQPGQGKGHHGEHGYWKSDSCRIQVMVADLSKELSLSEDQKKQIEEIHYAHMNEVEKMHMEYKNDCVGEHEACIQLREKMDADVKKVLNKEQQALYDEFMKERRGPHGNHHGPRN